MTEPTRFPLEEARQRAVAAIQAIPRRSGTPGWGRGAAIAQAFGFDMGLATAADTVAAALSESSRPPLASWSQPDADLVADLRAAGHTALADDVERGIDPSGEVEP